MTSVTAWISVADMSKSMRIITRSIPLIRRDAGARSIAAETIGSGIMVFGAVLDFPQELERFPVSYSLDSYG